MKSADVEHRLKELEINVAKHQAIDQERHRSLISTLERFENSINQNSKEIDKLFTISNKGIGGLKLFVWLGTVIISVVGYIKLKPYL